MNKKGTPENIKPYEFRPGVSGNPGGRPKKRPITDHYFEISERVLPEELRAKINANFAEEMLPKGALWAEAWALRRGLDCLEQGGYMAAKEMREAMEGKAAQRLEITTAPKTEITIRIKNDRKKGS